MASAIEIEAAAVTGFSVKPDPKKGATVRLSLEFPATARTLQKLAPFLNGTHAAVTLEPTQAQLWPDEDDPEGE